jgi:hypothetical protein
VHDDDDRNSKYNNDDINTAKLNSLRRIAKQMLYVGFEVLTAVVMKSTIFWDITSCSPLYFKRCFGGTYSQQLNGGRISRAINKLVSRWQAEAICSSEKSVDIQRTTRRYIPEANSLLLKCCTCPKRRDVRSVFQVSRKLLGIFWTFQTTSCATWLNMQNVNLYAYIGRITTHGRIVFSKRKITNLSAK